MTSNEQLRRFGIVLCGGESKRMGRPKAWLPFGGEVMLQRVVRLMRFAVEKVIVVAAQEQELPPLPDVVSVTRDVQKKRGPLQGIAAGLELVSQTYNDPQGSAIAAFVTSCDAPFLNPALVRRMFELLGEDLICVPKIQGRYHPLAGVYRLEVMPSVNELLHKDSLQVTCLFDTVPTRSVTAEELIDVDPQLHSLKNLNTPEEHEQAAGAWGKIESCQEALCSCSPPNA